MTSSPSKPTVSVVIPTYNRVEMVQRAIRSVLAQTFEDLQVLVVDDGSTDQTQAALAKIEDPRLRVLVHDSNRGGSAARNTGLEHARGRFVGLLDSDDEWLPQKLEKQIAVYERSQDPDLGIVLCGCEFVNVDHRRHHAIPRTKGAAFDALLHRQGGLDGVPSTTALLRRDEELRFDERLPSAQDWDFLLQYARRYHVDFAADVLVRVHREHSGPRIGSSATRIAQGRKMMLEKYQDELRERPTSRSRHHVRLALTLVRLGNMSQARRHLRQAFLAYPRCLPCWLWWVAAFLGRFPLRVALRLFDHPSLH